MGSATDPNGASTTAGPNATQGTIGQVSADVGYLVQFNAIAAGTYSFELWMTDEMGNNSNRLSGSITAQ